MLGGKAHNGAVGSVPLPAFQAGYKLNTFLSEFGVGEIDITKSLAPGFKWYPYNWFGSNPDMSKVTGGNGAELVLTGDTTGPNGQILTCGVKPGNTYVGKAFGGGAYVEATLKFDPQTVQSFGPNGWPSFWCLPIEKGLAPTMDQWPGQAANYEHYVEWDIFEYIFSGARPASYDGTLHDWYGVYTSLGDVSNVPDNVLPVPDIGYFNNFHKYGSLWIPATDNTLGSVQFFFDRRPVGKRFTFSKYTGQAPTPVGQPWRWGVIDQHHHALILGTGPGANMTVNRVEVWQATDANNWTA